MKKYKFIFDFLQTRAMYPFYKTVRNTYSNEEFAENRTEPSVNTNEMVHVVNYVPPFVRPILHDTLGDGHLKGLHYKQYQGFMIDLEGYTEIYDYVKAQIPTSGSRVRGYAKKLESCFDITYTYYFGDISREKYDFLLHKTRTLISKRFEQKGYTHELLDQWDFITGTTYDMILKKTASLFVIYSGKVPIDICLNYHFQNIYHNGIRAYDIDYAKFSLGHIDIYKQLEWCLANDYRIFDLSVGDMAYKRRWCNVIYEFEHQIIYDANKPFKRLTAFALLCLFKTKAYLKKKDVHLLYHRLRNLGRKERDHEQTGHETLFELTELDPNHEISGMPVVDLENDSLELLKKHVFDFQRKYMVHYKNLSIYKDSNQPDTFLICGKGKIQQLKKLPSDFVNKAVSR